SVVGPTRTRRRTSPATRSRWPSSRAARSPPRSSAWPATSGPRCPAGLRLNGKPIELPLAPLPTREQWEEKAKRTDAIGHHARVQLEKLARHEEQLTEAGYPRPQCAL